MAIDTTSAQALIQTQIQKILIDPLSVITAGRTGYAQAWSQPAAGPSYRTQP